MFPRLLIFMCLEVLSTKISAKKHGAEFSDFCIGSAKCCARTISTFAFRTPSEKRSLKISTKHPINWEDGPECKYMQEPKSSIHLSQIAKCICPNKISTKHRINQQDGPNVKICRNPNGYFVPSKLFFGCMELLCTAR